MDSGQILKKVFGEGIQCHLVKELMKSRRTRIISSTFLNYGPNKGSLEIRICDDEQEKWVDKDIMLISAKEEIKEIKRFLRKKKTVRFLFINVKYFEYWFIDINNMKARIESYEHKLKESAKEGVDQVDVEFNFEPMEVNPDFAEMYKS